MKNLFRHQLNESVAAKAAISCIKGRKGLCESIPTFGGKTYNGGIDVDEDGNLYAFGGYDDDDFVNVPYLNKFDDIHKDVVDTLNRTFWTWFYDSDNYVDNIDQYTDDNVGTAIEKVLDATDDFPSNSTNACYRWFKKHGDEVLDNLIWSEKERHLAKHPQFTFEQAEEESGQVSIKITKKLEDEAYKHLCDVYKKYRGRGPQTWEVVTEYIMKKHNLDPYKSWHELTQGDKNALNALNKKLGRKWQKQHADDELLIKYNRQHGVAEQEEENVRESLPTQYEEYVLPDACYILTEFDEFASVDEDTAMEVLKPLLLKTPELPWEYDDIQEWIKENKSEIAKMLGSVEQQQEETNEDKAAIALKHVKKYKSRLPRLYGDKPEMFMMLKLDKTIGKNPMKLPREEYREWAKAICDACDKVFNRQEEQEEIVSSLQRGDILNALAQQADTYPELMSEDGDLDEIFNIIAEVIDEQQDYPFDSSEEECDKWIDKYYDRLVAEFKKNKSEQVLNSFEQDQEYDMVTLLADRLSESYLTEDWEDIYYAVKRFSNVLTHYMPEEESEIRGWLRRWVDDIQDIINTPANARNVNEKVDDLFEIMMQHGGIEILYNTNKNVVKDEIRKQLSNTPEDQFPWSQYLSKKSWVQQHKRKIADRLEVMQKEQEGYFYV